MILFVYGICICNTSTYQQVHQNTYSVLPYQTYDQLTNNSTNIEFDMKSSSLILTPCNMLFSKTQPRQTTTH